MAARVFGEPMRIPPPVPEGVDVRLCRWVPALGGRLSGMRGPASAVTLGPMILVHPRVQLTERLLRHELAHVAQWRRRPFTFPIRYLWCHLRFGYTDNPYELEAREAERGATSSGAHERRQS